LVPLSSAAQPDYIGYAQAFVPVFALAYFSHWIGSQKELKDLGLGYGAWQGAAALSMCVVLNSLLITQRCRTALHVTVLIDTCSSA
jgi:hypothetical protein